MYIQWITCLLISCFVKGGASSVILITNCFQLSMIIALVYMTILQGSNLQVSEAYLMFIICAGSFTTPGVLDVRLLHRFDRKDAEAYTAALGTAIQVILQFVLIAYGVWFFFTSMDSMQHPPCSRSGFLFVRVDLYHWMRTVFKVLFAAAIPSLILSLVFQIVLNDLLSQTRIPPMPPTSGALAETDVDSNASRITISVFNPETPFVIRGWAGIAIDFSNLCGFILAVELIIKWNHIQGVNQMGSTGQILPFVVAVGGLISAMCQFLLQTVSVEGSGGVEIAVV